jgi:hypothetical protein
MTAAYVFLMLAGAGAMIGVPARFIQVVRGSFRAAYSRLNLLPKFFVTIGFFGLLLGGLSWIGVAYVAVKVIADDATPRIWGGSEIGLTSASFGALYLVVEFLLLPLTIRQIRNERAVSAK